MPPETDAPRAPRTFLARTAALALVLGLASLGVVHQLARVSGSRGPVVASLPDPEVTGSIGAAAHTVVLDPCNGRERLVVRGPVGLGR